MTRTVLAILSVTAIALSVITSQAAQAPLEQEQIVIAQADVDCDSQTWPNIPVECLKTIDGQKAEVKIRVIGDSPK